VGTPRGRQGDGNSTT